MLKGIDVSHHNSQINFDDYDFVIVRAGFGKYDTQIDKKFKYHMDELFKSKIPCGIYWFSYAKNINEARQEANVCYNIIKEYIDNIALGIWYDFEYDSESFNSSINYNNTLRSQIIFAFINRMKELTNNKKVVGYYTNKDYYFNRLNKEILKNIPIWFAYWSYETEKDLSGIDNIYIVQYTNTLYDMDFLTELGYKKMYVVEDTYDKFNNLIKDLESLLNKYK